jgi:cytochrome P450
LANNKKVGYLPFRALIRPFLGTSIQDYIGGKAAAESYKFTLLAISRMDERMKLEDQNNVSHEKKADGKQRKDVFHYIYHARDPDTGKSFTKEELQANSALLIAAGSDGVALTISACVFYLLHNPRTYEKLVAELRGSFASVDEIRGPKVTALPYLHACIMETMRIAPAIPSDLPRVVLPGGLMIPSSGDDENSNKPVHIPEGTTVFVPQYAIQHNESYYPDPWAFKPERFIVSDETSAESVARAKKAYCPFSTGPMDCAGKNMAYLAMKLALAHMLWRFDVRLAPPANVKVVDGPMEEWEMGPTGGGHVRAKEEGRRRTDEYQILDFMAGYRDGPTVQLRERV